MRQVPTEQEVTSFLDECCEVARSAVETRLAATRSAAASSLGIDEYDLDKKFASNCVEVRIKTLQDNVRLAHQQMQGIQEGAEGAATGGAGHGAVVSGGNAAAPPHCAAKGTAACGRPPGATENFVQAGEEDSDAVVDTEVRRMRAVVQCTTEDQQRKKCKKK